MTAPHRTRLPLIIGLALAAGSAGFYLGRTTLLVGEKSDPHELAKTRPAAISAVGATTQPASVGSATWEALARAPATVKRNRAMAAYLEQLATTHPEEAMRLAQAETNRRLRETLLAAALRGWARVAPEAAAAWGLAQAEPSDRTRALRAVFAGAAERPEEAVRLGRMVFERDPAGAAEHGVSLIDGLIDAGYGDVAGRLALDSNPSRPVWVIEAFSKWSALQPIEAAQTADALPEGEGRANALRGVADGWGEADPGGLSQFLAGLPTSGLRCELLGHAIRQWVTIDPGSASKWINSVELGSDMDEGVAAVATMASLKPDVATSWAESIENRQLRSETLATILREWGRTDPAAAVQYLTTSRNLQPDERRMLTEFFRTNLNVAVP